MLLDYKTGQKVRFSVCCGKRAAWLTLKWFSTLKTSTWARRPTGQWWAPFLIPQPDTSFRVPTLLHRESMDTWLVQDFAYTEL